MDNHVSREGFPVPEPPRAPAPELPPAATPPITRPFKETRPRPAQPGPHFDGHSALDGVVRATRRPAMRPAASPAIPATTQFIRPASPARRLPIPPSSGPETVSQFLVAAASDRDPNRMGNDASGAAGPASDSPPSALAGSGESAPEPQPGAGGGGDQGSDPPPPEGPSDVPLAGGEEPEGDSAYEPSRDVGPPGVYNPGDPERSPNPTGREAWQAARVADNFSEGTGPFLPPLFMDDDDDEAWELFNNSDRRDFGQFVADRADEVEALDQELRTLVPQMPGILREGMQAAIEAGYVPAIALERLAPAFTQTAIRAADQTVLGEGEDDRDIAVYDQAADIVTVGTDALHNDGLQLTIAHEVVGHKNSGGTFITREDGTVVRVRRGFVNHNDSATTPSARHYGLDEAVQQHLALFYLHGEPDVIDPDARADRNTSCYEHRKLLATFIERSGGIIDLKPITRGSYEDSDESGAVTTDRRAMVMQAGAAYGPGAYHKLSQLSDKIIDGMPLDVAAERIHGPEFSADGSVKRPGFIDVDFSFPSDQDDL